MKRGSGQARPVFRMINVSIRRMVWKGTSRLRREQLGDFKGSGKKDESFARTKIMSFSLWVAMPTGRSNTR